MATVPVRIKSVDAGSPARELVGFVHRARRKDPAKPARAVLMLNPFGQEAVRTHRLMRVAADRLARSGHDVLRFDYYGSGDSPGDDLDANLHGWARDTLAAHQMLLEISPGASISWLGFRLGASVALLAARQLAGPQAKSPPAQLVLWEPVLDGQAHLKALAADHRRALFASYSLPGEPGRLIKNHEAQWPPTELMGFAVSEKMTAQISELTGKALAVATPSISLLAGKDGAAQATSQVAPASPSHEADWRQACQASGTIFSAHPFDSDFDWTSEEALNTALVPAPAVTAILAAISGQ